MKKKFLKLRKKKSKGFKIFISIFCIIMALVLWVGVDLIIGISIKEAPRRPDRDFNLKPLQEIVWLVNNKTKTNPNIDMTYNDLTESIVLEGLVDPIEYIEKRYDCADFRAIDLLNIYLNGGEEFLSLSADNKIENRIKDALTGFKFWITSAGDDSMCYYSENHQALFAVVEYLSGYTFPQATFSIDNKSGEQHIEIAKTRLMSWLDMRETYGFSEHLSNNYYPVEITALTMLIRFGDRTDTELMTKTKIVLDLLFLDYALNLYNFTYETEDGEATHASFISPSGRAYANNANYWDSTLVSYAIVDYVWSFNKVDTNTTLDSFVNIILSNMKAKDEQDNLFYEVPQVIIEIGKDTEKTVKTSTGLNLSELKNENLLGLSDKQIMFQLGMGALTNPEVVNNTLDFINKYDLLSNNFVSNMKFMNISLFRYLNLVPLASKILDIFPNGFALQRFNNYTHMTEDYKLSTNQAYQPGSFGSQQSQMTASFPGGAVVYTSHPSRTDIYTQTPGYWAGYGVAPHAVQDKNVSMLIYELPKSITLAPAKVPDFTHTYLPEDLFENIIVEGKYAFAKVNNTYIALIGTSPLEYLDRDEDTLVSFIHKTTKRFDLVQTGRNQAWVYEISTLAEEGSFVNFMTRIKQNALSFDKNVLTYETRDRKMKATYKGDFVINDETQNTEYKRIESKYVVADRNSESFIIEHNGYTLNLDIANNLRTYS